ncbi:MAG: helix-turn-helix domain-containing protein [Actinobacteria bacterium]|nr:helix-turn-helix domain-containing protein [Actinomycetota bacterium]
MTGELTRERFEDLAALAQSRGRTVAEAFTILEATLRLTPPASRAPARDWAEPELRILADEGVGDGLLAADSAGAGYEAAVGLARQLTEALTVEEAATHLGVTPSRVRQRLAARSLYGVRVGGRWRIPEWQLRGPATIPHLATILRNLRPELHPLTVHGFFTAPKPELQRDGRPMEPIAWLATGGDPTELIRLAAAL